MRDVSTVEQIIAGEHDQVERTPEGHFEVSLRWPFKSGSETVEKLTLRRPRFKDYRAMDKADGEMAKAAALLSALSGRSSKELDEVDADDWQVMMACVAAFSAAGQRTGAAG